MLSCQASVGVGVLAVRDVRKVVLFLWCRTMVVALVFSSSRGGVMLSGVLAEERGCTDPF